MKSTFRSICAATLLLSACATALADPVLWVSDSRGQLAKIDVLTGSTTLVGDTGVFMFDIAFNATGQLFGISGTALYSINSTTAASTLIGTTGSSSNINSLVFGSDGTLYGASNGLYKFNTTTGAGTQIGTNFASGASSSGDLAFVGGKLYLSTLGSPSDRLANLNTSTGALTDVGSIGFASVFGMASPNGADLYGFSDNRVLSINATTGAGRLLSTANGPVLGAVYGSAFFNEAVPTPAIPEPSTYALLTVGLIGLGFAAKRKQKL
jgi:hypothetical protein